MDPTAATADEPVYTRAGNFAVFNQRGVKLTFSDLIPLEDYYCWLDEMTREIASLVEGAAIAEKSYARLEPRMNTGVYYDTPDYWLLAHDMVLRTTCNIKTHAFCAFKQAEDVQHIRRDHRYIFEDEEKRTIQTAPTSPEAIAIVKGLLLRNDFEHPGTHLFNATGLTGDDLAPAVCLQQYRHPFFVWLDKRDALRCSMDRVQVRDLRLPLASQQVRTFSEIELPIYPHIDDDMAKDSRVSVLIDVLATSLRERFEVDFITASKYRRAGTLLGLLPTEDNCVLM